MPEFIDKTIDYNNLLETDEEKEQQKIEEEFLWQCGLKVAIKKLNAALLQLSESMRTVIKLRFHKNLSLSQIAKKLKISKGSAQSYYKRGVKRLQGILGSDFMNIFS